MENIDIEEEKRTGARTKVRLHRGPLHGAILWILSDHDQILLDCKVVPVHNYLEVDTHHDYQVRAYYREVTTHSAEDDGARRFSFVQLVT